MLAEVGGITCSFNQTVSEKTLPEIKEVYNWARKYPDIVHSVVFILYRAPSMESGYDFYAGGEKINMGEPYWDTIEWSGTKVLKAQDAVDTLREVEEGYEPSGYLNGTVDPESMKWLLSVRMAQDETTLGLISPKFMKTVQVVHHFFKDRWLSYSSPEVGTGGKISMLFFSLFDRVMLKTLGKYIWEVIKNPKRLLKPVYFQGFTVIQPVDFMADGQMNMCDGCPDITVHNGELYWSCRLEEIKEYGTFVSATPQKDETHKPEVIMDDTSDRDELTVQ